MSFKQLHVGRDEPILEPDLPIIDAHHHLFDRPALRYLFDEYLADTRAGHRIIASVYVETQAYARTSGPEALRPIGEIEFANGVAAVAASGRYGPCGIASAIVGYADLRFGHGIGEYLDRALRQAPDRFRGIRQIMIDDPGEAPYQFIPVRPPRALMQHPEFRNGIRELTRRGLSFDAALFHHQLPELIELADAFPQLSIVLNHAGQAMRLGLDERARSEVFQVWRTHLVELSRRPNVVCKIGGFGLPFWAFGLHEREDPVGYRELADTWRPYVEESVGAFGAERCMMASDYPIDSRSCGFVPLWNALKDIVRSMSDTEKTALFCGTAGRVYRIDVQHLLDAAQASARLPAK